MKITRADLIKMCDKFLSGQINKSEIEDYAWELITSDEIEWNNEDEILHETIFDWDNDLMDFPINKVNMALWKKRLIKNIDELSEYNIWNVHIEKQKINCNRYTSKWNPINKKLNVGVSKDLLSDPINGLRHTKEKGTTGWFIWTGEYSESKDFFEPMCAEHLLQIRPQIIKYLGLDVGYRFLTDKTGYEDVWYDEKLINI